MAPRGIRNNNPGNIRHSPTNWKGECKGEDKSFKTFESPVYGIRAMAKLLRNYQRLYGLYTLTQMISRWAPPNENDTQAYIDYVSRRSGVAPDVRVEPDDFPKVIAAMINMENGRQPYDDETIAEGCRLGLA
ncbi:hypothetical protein [Desulfovibrio inopinatus]|uniref:hypothetical protein n=1 Tax=Desulfovibrio inopinatus TaxID=102109 RepID=UPI0003F654C9|nr:hypothetical protein [Desulfovibrio inopinatus]